MAHGGRGVARQDGKVFFVEDALEGDEIRALVRKDSGRYADGEILEITTPSPYRIPPPCPHAMTCGGCTWQHADPEAQQRWKIDAARNLFQRIAQLPWPEKVVLHSSPQNFSYRNRVLLRGRLSPEGLFTFGYFRKGSRDFIAVEDCLIAVEPIRQFIRSQKTLRNFSPTEAYAFKFEIQEAPVSSGRLLISFYPNGREDPVAQKICAAWRDLPEVAWCDFVFLGKQAEPFLFEHFEGYDFWTKPGSFQQVNIPLNHLLRRTVLDLVKQEKPREILDLYCGSGNLSTLPAAEGIVVTGIEISQTAIALAQGSFHRQNLTGKFAAQPVDLWLKKNRKLWDFIILDPPREGLGDSLPHLLRAASRDILYVSCDPATLARDLATLKRSFTIRDVQLFDFFPQTFHVESFVHLQKT